MRFSRRILIVLFAAISLTIAVLNPSVKKAYSAQITSFQQEAADVDNASQAGQIEGSVSSFDQDHFADISNVLNMVETGQKALQLIDKYQISVVFESGKGSGFYPYRNEIIIDSNFGKFSAAIVLVHEVTHARLFHEGLAASPALYDRPSYVQMRLEEETQAMVASIEATSELWEAGVDISNLHPSLYYPYKQAYGAAVRAAEYDNPGLDDEALQVIGRAAGQKAVLEAVLDGQVVTAATHQTYLEYWGSVWDLKRGL